MKAHLVKRSSWGIVLEVLCGAPISHKSDVTESVEAVTCARCRAKLEKSAYRTEETHSGRGSRVLIEEKP